MKKGIFILLISLLWSMTSYSQNFAIKNNLLYDATLTPNLGFEFGLSKKSTLDINAGYNPFTFSKGKSLKHWAVQPEYRYWTCEKFNGSFWGFHLHGGEFSFAGIKLPFGMFPSLRDYRYEGFFLGGGISFGHQWILSKRWNLEASIGAGYAHIKYDKYPCRDCGPKIKSGHYNYFGPTKAVVSFIYIIN
ncbi:MAG: DUF3575 domain-containing protein [Bacteroides sp.]|nr:DUF3575 domain-containing protein [Bacteroides sp.]